MKTKSIRSVTITATLSRRGLWLVVCRQRRYFNRTRKLTRTVSIFLADIECHNEECLP